MTALQGLKLDAVGLSGGAQAFAARLLAREGAALCLDHDGEQRSARLALGCTYQPEPGDLVLAVPAGADIWVTALLARESGAPLRMAAPGGLTLETDGDLTVTAPRARVKIGELLHIGGKLVAELARLDLVAGLASTIAQQVTLHAGSYLRQVDILEQVKAGSIIQQAETSLELRAENAFLSADNLVRMDAEQVHIG